MASHKSSISVASQRSRRRCVVLGVAAFVALGLALGLGLGLTLAPTDRAPSAPADRPIEESPRPSAKPPAPPRVELVLPPAPSAPADRPVEESPRPSAKPPAPPPPALPPPLPPMAPPLPPAPPFPPMPFQPLAVGALATASSTGLRRGRLLLDASNLTLQKASSVYDALDGIFDGTELFLSTAVSFATPSLDQVPTRCAKYSFLCTVVEQTAETANIQLLQRLPRSAVIPETSLLTQPNIELLFDATNVSLTYSAEVVVEVTSSLVVDRGKTLAETAILLSDWMDRTLRERLPAVGLRGTFDIEIDTMHPPNPPPPPPPSRPPTQPPPLQPPPPPITPPLPLCNETQMLLFMDSYRDCMGEEQSIEDVANYSSLCRCLAPLESFEAAACRADQSTPLSVGQQARLQYELLCLPETGSLPQPPDETLVINGSGAPCEVRVTQGPDQSSFQVLLVAHGNAQVSCYTDSSDASCCVDDKSTWNVSRDSNVTIVGVLRADPTAHGNVTVYCEAWCTLLGPSADGSFTFYPPPPPPSPSPPPSPPSPPSPPPPPACVDGICRIYYRWSSHRAHKDGKVHNTPSQPAQGSPSTKEACKAAAEATGDVFVDDNSGNGRYWRKGCFRSDNSGIYWNSDAVGGSGGSEFAPRLSGGRVVGTPDPGLDACCCYNWGSDRAIGPYHRGGEQYDGEQYGVFSGYINNKRAAVFDGRYYPDRGRIGKGEMEGTGSVRTVYNGRDGEFDFYFRAFPEWVCPRVQHHPQQYTYNYKSTEVPEYCEEGEGPVPCYWEYAGGTPYDDGGGGRVPDTVHDFPPVPECTGQEWPFGLNEARPPYNLTGPEELMCYHRDVSPCLSQCGHLPPLMPSPPSAPPPSPSSPPSPGERDSNSPLPI